MRSERGQASVEWIGLVLLLALGLSALARLAPRADAGGLGTEVLHALTCAAGGGCDARAASGAPGNAPERTRARPSTQSPRRLVTAPPLVPIAPAERRPRPAERHLRPGERRPRPAERRPASGGRPWLQPRRFAGPLLRRAGRGAGLLWRRSWLLCLGYERVRYGVLHPEIRFPHQTIPLSEDVRIANDCLSPVDLVRDWDQLRGRP
jgi:hypothetical protein